MSSISFAGKASFTRRALTAAAMSGALSVAALGVAGQAGAATTSTTSVGQAHPQLAHPQLCSKASRRRAHGAKLVAVSTSRLNRIKAMEAKAKAAGRQKRVTYLEKVISHDQTVLARQNARYKANQAKVSKAAAARCKSKS